MLAFTPGEPAGIGPDLAVKLAQQRRDYDIVAFINFDLLAQRAEWLGVEIDINTATDAPLREPGTLTIYPVQLDTTITPKQLTPNSATYVLETIRLATEGCLSGDYSALVTGPIHKGVINQQIPFSGHTEYLQSLSGVDEVVMLLAYNQLRVALVTTHLPLSEVASTITREKLEKIIRVLHHGLVEQFGIPNPRILVAGLNPHAGEDGHMGREEIEIISPVLQQLRSSGMDLVGPLPADTLFTDKYLQQADAVLAMYHDQGLPVLKHDGFGRSVNITLGLPFLRTSVDHGTALELAGTGEADMGSLEAAIQVALGR